MLIDQWSAVVKKIESESKKTKVLAIVGPTAVGKTAVSQILADLLEGEIISADSMQVYRGMDIGTAKPSCSERKKYSYHLIDVADPQENFSVARYQRLARKAIEEISSQQKMPILAGGSGLYARAVIDPLDFPSGAMESPSRKHLEQELTEKGPDYLIAKLKELDPEAAKNIHPANIRRVIRALEVIQEKDGLFSSFQKNWQTRESIYDLRMFGLTCCREELYEKIELRVDVMLEQGLIEEVKQLMERGFRQHLTSTQALGYKEVIDFLQGETSLDEMIELIKKRTRQYAKRQLTWFRRDHRVAWISLDQKTYSQAGEEIVELLKLNGFLEE